MQSEKKTTEPWRSEAFRRQPVMPAPAWRISDAIRTGRRRVFRWKVADHFRRQRRPRWVPLATKLYYRRIAHGR
jgi:hypothetical protein